jgi:hypothetical protein
MDSAALTTLVDWWRLETHTFHLLCGETTVTLLDVTMILGLPIDVTPVCGIVSSAGWRDKKTMCVHSGWLIANINTCSEGAVDAVVQRYVLSCV